MSKARKAARRPRGQGVNVFISHASADRTRATGLGRLFARHGLKYWYSREHLIHGQDWYRGIGDALESCNWLVIVGSRKAIRNKWVKDEVTYALVEKRYRNRVIPLLFETCNLRSLAWSLQSIQYIDFRTNRRRATEQLLARLGADRNAGRRVTAARRRARKR